MSAFGCEADLAETRLAVRRFAGNSEGIVSISPLDPGRYEFMGEYHSDRAKGVVIAE